MFCQTHNVRPRSRAFIEARTQRLLLDTLIKYGHPCVLSDHGVELIREEIEQARSGDPISETISASIDTTSTEIFPSYVHHQSWLLSLFEIRHTTHTAPLAFSPPRTNRLNLTARRPSRILPRVSHMFPHWASYVGWCVCHSRIPTENPPTAPVPHQA